MIQSYSKIEKFKDIIKKRGIFKSDQHKIITPEGNPGSWIIDMRNVFMKSDALDLITDIFWELFAKEYPFQVGGQEISAIPLISAILLKGQSLNKPVSGFMVRKLQKTTGLQKIIEGEISNEKIILVDDSIRIGTTFKCQVEILKDINKRVDAIFAIVAFKASDSYEFIKQNNIKLFSLYSLDDFGLKGF